MTFGSKGKTTRRRARRATKQASRRMSESRNQAGTLRDHAVDLRYRAAPVVTVAVDRAKPVASAAIERAKPITAAIRDNARPVAEDLAARARPAAESLIDRSRPAAQYLAETVRDRAVPAAEHLVERAKPAAESLVERVRPAASDAAERIMHEAHAITSDSHGSPRSAARSAADGVRGLSLPALGSAAAVVRDHAQDVAKQTRALAKGKSKKARKSIDKATGRNRRRWPVFVAGLAVGTGIGAVAGLFGRRLVMAAPDPASESTADAPSDIRPDVVRADPSTSASATGTAQPSSGSGNSHRTNESRDAGPASPNTPERHDQP